MKKIFKWVGAQARLWGSHSFVWWLGYLTAVYIGLVIMVVAARFGEVLALPLNELGDFSAGAFGPIAFLWLIFGYKQQGDELKASSSALEAQVAELKTSIDLQRLNAEKQDLMVDPVFYLNPFDSNVYEGKIIDRLLLTNKGDACRDVYIDVMNQDWSPIWAQSYVHALPRDMQHPFDLGQIPVRTMVVIVVNYIRLNGSKSRQGFNFFKMENGEPRTMKIPLM